MNIAAYCRVSTDKEDQLNSLETQKEFFLEYTKRTGDNLIKLYADEGISGTKIKNRKEFQRMLADAEKGLFDMVVVKDISRFARNTVDLLQSVRKLKALGIETQFLTANMTSMGNSEFVLTIFGALAQEESANTSKRIKFGKKMNAEKGRVPNIVYGYDKTIGDYFNLSINEEEAKVIRQMYKWYTEEGYGGAKIANMLNERGIKTKRGNNWSQNSVCRILTNEIYTGKIINGKEEVSDFLTGQRKEKDESEWLVTIRPELRIIDDEIFDRAQEILKGRHDSFKMTHERQSNKHLFSTLIKCKDCGWSFRRTVRQYKNTYIRWVCSGHNGRGADSCPNAITVDEEELIQVLQEYFQDVLSKKKKVIDHVIKEFQRVYKAKDENVEYEKELTTELNRLRKAREKYMDMYTDDLISREELNEKIGGMRKEIDRLENELKMVSYNLTKGEQLEAILNSTFKEMEDITDVHEMTNTQLKRLINKIEVDKDGNVDIYLRLIGDLGLDETVLIEGTEDSDVDYEVGIGKNDETTPTKTIPNCTNHTYGIFRAVMHYMGYLIKAAHIAVVSEAVTTGVIPENMVQVGKDMVKSRFATSNVYIVLDKLVGGAVKQLQKAVGSVGSLLGDIPGIGAIVNILQMFIGIALGYIDECCLGYTFYKKDEKAFKAGCDGVVIYFQNTKHLLKSAVGTTAIVLGLSFVAWLIPFIIFGLIFGAIGVPFAWLFASLIAIIIAAAIKSAFIDSYMMVKTMVSYMSVAPSTQITFDIYDKLCKLSSKFKQLFTKSKEETATM